MSNFLLQLVSTFNAGELIRFRVSAENFVETSPSGPEQSEIPSTSDTGKPEQKIPYTLTVS